MSRRRAYCCCDQAECCAATSVAISGEWSIHFRAEDAPAGQFGWYTAANIFATASSMIEVNPVVLQAASTVRSNSQTTGPECRYQRTPPPTPNTPGSPFLNGGVVKRQDFGFTHTSYKVWAYAEPFKFFETPVWYEAGFLVQLFDTTVTFGVCDIFLGRVARPASGSCPWGPYAIGDLTDPATRYRGLARIHQWNQSSSIMNLGDTVNSTSPIQFAYDEEGDVVVS